MKKQLMLTLAIAFIGVLESNGQWAANGTDIYNTNSGNVGIGTNTPATLLYVAKNMTEPNITVRNMGGTGGATYTMIDDASAANWKFKATSTGGFKIRDHASSLDVFVIEKNSAANSIYIDDLGNVGIGTSNPLAKFHVPAADAIINDLTIGKGGGSIAFNTAIGDHALSLNSSGTENVALGYYALVSNGNGINNTAIGTKALYFNDGDNNTAVGRWALYTNNTGYRNTAIGSLALYENEDGIQNTATGRAALYSNVSGADNTATGYYSQYSNNSGNSNTTVGSYSLQNNSTGSYNVALGAHSGQTANNLSNVICIGYNATAASSNQVRIGNNSIGSIGGYQDWTNISDGRFKEDIKENIPGLDFIVQLRPVSYILNREEIDKFTGITARNEQMQKENPEAEVLNREKYSPVTTGFIAQEVEAAARNCGFEFSGIDTPDNENDLYGLRYASFVVPMVKAIQEQQQIIQKQQKQIDALMERVEELEGK
jgi:hypothetical protein